MRETQIVAAILGKTRAVTGRSGDNGNLGRLSLAPVIAENGSIRQDGWRQEGR